MSEMTYDEVLKWLPEKYCNWTATQGISALRMMGDAMRDLAALQKENAELRAFRDAVTPFLSRLREPRYDKSETNDYICGSTDCQTAIDALKDSHES